MADSQTMLAMLESMLRIRAFEEKINHLFSRGLIYGTTHLCIGQEASAVGVCSALAEGDKVIGNHRSHGHALGLGLSAERLMGELLGREQGYCAGIGGTQHVASPSEGFLGSNGITCGGMPVAVGVAFALKRQDQGRVCTVFIGDGATNQGVFHESMNLAAIWKAPLLVVCENNLYAMSTPFQKTLAGGSLTRRGEAYGIKVLETDGMDVLAVRQAADEALAHLRSGCGPFFLVNNTYRFLGHSKSDARLYRTRDEEKQWRRKDPIPRLAAQLVKEDVASDEELQAMKTRIQEDIASCYERCLADKILCLDHLRQLCSRSRERCSN